MATGDYIAIASLDLNKPSIALRSDSGVEIYPEYPSSAVGNANGSIDYTFIFDGDRITPGDWELWGLSSGFKDVAGNVAKERILHSFTVIAPLPTHDAQTNYESNEDIVIILTSPQGYELKSGSLTFEILAVFNKGKQDESETVIGGLSDTGIATNQIPSRITQPGDYRIKAKGEYTTGEPWELVIDLEIVEPAIAIVARQRGSSNEIPNGDTVNVNEYSNYYDVQWITEEQITGISFEVDEGITTLTNTQQSRFSFSERTGFKQTNSKITFANGRTLDYVIYFEFIVAPIEQPIISGITQGESLALGESKTISVTFPKSDPTKTVATAEYGLYRMPGYDPYSA
ncbi:MAG: hypothetical protein AAFW67_11150, partial [Cyanobacteria bacterium J06638_38]